MAVLPLEKAAQGPGAKDLVEKKLPGVILVGSPEVLIPQATGWGRAGIQEGLLREDGSLAPPGPGQQE